MPEDTMKPQDTVIYLLGELKGEVGSLKQSVDSSATSQGTFNASMQTEINHLKTALSDEAAARQTADADLESSVAVLQALRPMKHGWPNWLSAVAVAISTLFVIYTSIMHH